MVEIRWVLEPGGQALELLPSIAEFCHLAAQAAGETAGGERVIVTVGLSLLGIQAPRGGQGAPAAVGQVWARGEWVIPRGDS